MIGPPDFNPHSRTGSDDSYRHTNGKLRISIHTPARGVTGLSNTISITAKISIHTPARGVTEPEIATRLETLISIHTPARGVTVAYLVMFNNLRFQSTLPHGE